MCGEIGAFFIQFLTCRLPIGYWSLASTNEARWDAQPVVLTELTGATALGKIYRYHSKAALGSLKISIGREGDVSNQVGGMSTLIV